MEDFDNTVAASGAVPNDMGLPLVHDRLRLVVDSISEGFGLLAPDFTILELNNEAMRIDKRRREDVVGLSHWVAYPGTEHSEVGKMYKKAMTERVSLTLEHAYDWSDGRSSWFETRVFPTSDGCLAVFFRDMSDRQQAEARLRQSELRFKAAIDAVDGIMWTNDASGKMTGPQPGWQKLTGQTQQEYQDYGWASAIHFEERLATVKAWRAAVSEQTSFSFQHRVLRHDGQWRLFDVRAVPLLHGSAVIKEWVGIHRDITEIRANEIRLQQLADNISEVFYVFETEQNRISYVSSAYEKMWGRTCAELYADYLDFKKSIHPDDRPQVEAAMARQRKGENTEIEYRLLRGDGSTTMIHDRAFATSDPVTGALRVVGFAADITAYRQAQQTLSRNAEIFSNLVNFNPFGIYVVDADFRLSQISLGARSVFSVVDNPIGMDFADVLRKIWAEPFASEAISIFRHTLSTGEPYVNTATIEKRADSDAVEAYDWRIERIILPDGRYGVVCYFYDLSERNMHEMKLKQALADADLLTREIDHRVKNSLALVSAFLNMQRKGADPIARAALDDASRRVVAVAKLHEQLHKSDRLGIVSLGDYLRNLCEELQKAMRMPNIVMQVTTVEVSLPAQQAIQLGLIANELVTNAFKHARSSGATKVSVDMRVDGPNLVMCIEDDGAGLPATATETGAGLGFRLIDGLTRQLNASLEFPLPGTPARFELRMAALSP